MSIKSKIKTFFFLDDDYEGQDEGHDEEEMEPIKQHKQPS